MEALSFDQRLALAGIVLGIIALLVGLGVTLAMDAKTKGEFRFAVACFILSASMLCFTLGVWQVTTDVRWHQRFLISGCCFALIGVLLVEGIRWTHGRHLHASASPPNQAPPAPIVPPLTSESHPTKEKQHHDTKAENPNLNFLIRQIASHNSHPPFPPGTLIIVIGYLTNRSQTPVGVLQWGFKITPSGERDEIDCGLIGGNFETLELADEKGQVTEKLSWKHDYLPEVMARKTLGWGETVPSFVVFVAPKVDFNKVKLKGTIYKFNFQDTLGKWHNVAYVGTGGDQPSLYFPGLSRP